MNFWLYIASSKKEKKKDWLYNTCYTEFCPCQKKEDAKKGRRGKKVRGQKGGKKKEKKSREEKRREERNERCAALAMAIVCCELAICRQF